MNLKTNNLHITHNSKIYIPILKKRFLSFILLCLGILSFSYAQNFSGRVTEPSSDIGLPGVSILLLNSNPPIGTNSDFEGNFDINANIGDTLKFSYVGYSNQLIVLSDRAFLNIELSEESELLKEVVVVGYGAVKKEDLTGVVAKIDAKKFNKGVVTAPADLLNGKVAGLQISNNAEPGGQSRIRLRGATSIDAQSAPLFVIDGVPLDDQENLSNRNPLNFINPNDILDITVLKDASAAAIYGSRGANGVIIVTTKSGSEGKPKLSYSNFYSVSQLAENPEVFNAANYRNAVNSKSPINERFLGDANTDWIEEITQNAVSNEHQLSVSGGLNKNSLKYYVSLATRDLNGVLKTSSNTNQTAAANISTKLFDDLIELDFRTRNTWMNDRFAPDVMNAARNFDPTQPVRDEESPFGGYFQWNNDLAVNNPVATLFLWDERGKAFRTLNNLKFKLNIPWIKGLSYNFNGAIDRTDGEKSILKYSELKEQEANDRNGFLHLEDEELSSDLIENYLRYNIPIKNDDYRVDVIAGHSWQEFSKENRWEFGNGLMVADNDQGFIYTEDIKQDSFIESNRLASFYGRTNMAFKNRYLLTASVRADGSSRFSPSNRWGYFGSAALGWRVLEEDFASGLRDIFTNLKVRLSYGITGNEDIGNFLFSTFYFPGTSDAAYQFGDDYVTTLRATGVDPTIKWERTSSFNLGVDFGFWNNRLSGSVDVYNKYTDDLLFTIAAPAFTNLSDRIITNIGEMENRGIELSLNGVVVDKEKFDWSLNFNIAHNQNEITKLDNNENEDFGGYERGGITGDVGQTIQGLRVGNSINTFRTYRHKRDAAGNPLPDTEDHNGDGIANLLDIYEDLNGDGLINDQDLYYGESADPDVMMGVTSLMSIGDFDFSFTVRSNLGAHVYNNVASSTGYFDFISDQSRVNNNLDPSAFENNFTERQLKSDVYIENANFVRLDNATLGYNFKNIKFLENLQLYVTGQNLLTITGYSGLDPETPLFGGQNGDTVGIDNNLYPTARTVLFGLRASFK